MGDMKINSPSQITDNENNLLSTDNQLIHLEPESNKSDLIREDNERKSIKLEAHEDFAPIDETDANGLNNDDNKVEADDLGKILNDRKTKKTRVKRGRKG